MASEKRNLVATFTTNTTGWTDDSNAYVEDENFAYSGDMDTAADYGRCPFQDISGTPSSLDEFKIRWYDSNSDHDNDTYELQVYNNHTTSWEALETFNSGNVIHTSLATDDHTSAMQTKFAAAADKTAFLNNLQIQLISTIKTGGGDDVRFAVAWCNFTHTYAAVLGDVNVSDPITVVESVTPLLPKLVKVISDSVSINELIQSLGLLSRSIDDSISISEAVLFLGQLAQSISDSVTVAEALSGSGLTITLLTASVIDSVSLAENLQLLLPELVVLLSDSVSVSDLISVLQEAMQVNVSESLTITELIASIMIAFANVSDSVVVVDSIIRGPNPAETIAKTMSFVSQMHTNINLDSILPVPLVT